MQIRTKPVGVPIWCLIKLNKSIKSMWFRIKPVEVLMNRLGQSVLCRTTVVEDKAYRLLTCGLSLNCMLIAFADSLHRIIA